MFHMRHRCRIFLFHFYFNYYLIYLIYDVMMNISTWNRMHFSTYLLNYNLLSNQTWPTHRYKQDQKLSEIFWTIWRTGAKFQVLFNLATCYGYSITNLGQDSSVSLFWKGEKGTFKNGKCQLLKMARSHYIVISIKW